MDLRRFRTLARNWDALGDEDPYFGVLSDPSKRARRWDRDEFFSSGRAHVENLLRTLHNARASVVLGTCLDFGCGVGRLTLPLSEHFEWTVGVDVAASMIDAARQHRPPNRRCEFVLNQHPDLRPFGDDSFDLVHSSLVLQHIAPDVSLRYVGEFVRVCKPGGLIVFQLPAAARSLPAAPESLALPDEAYNAGVEVISPPLALPVSALTPLRVLVTNLSPIAWRSNVDGGRPINVGNHWLREDGTRAIDDDGRGALPDRVDPGVSVEIPLTVRTPDAPGAYVLEVDLVQEHVCWFAGRGSATARVPIEVVAGSSPSVQPPASRRPPASSTSGPDGEDDPAPHDAGTHTAKAAASRVGIGRALMLRRLIARLRGATPTFEMHVVPREDVEQALASAGADTVCIVDDNAAGPAWLSYTYVARKRGPAGVGP